MVELEQIRTIDKTRLSDFMGTVSEEVMKEIDMAIKISLGVK
jgi:mRNA interferase MazF